MSLDIEREAAINSYVSRKSDEYLGIPKPVTFKQRDLTFARDIAIAEKYHLMSFSDGTNSAEHLIRVVELEIVARDLSKQIMSK